MDQKKGKDWYIQTDIEKYLWSKKHAWIFSKFTLIFPILFCMDKISVQVKFLRNHNWKFHLWLRKRYLHLQKFSKPTQTYQKIGNICENSLHLELFKSHDWKPMYGSIIGTSIYDFSMISSTYHFLFWKKNVCRTASIYLPTRCGLAHKKHLWQDVVDIDLIKGYSFLL